MLATRFCFSIPYQLKVRKHDLLVYQREKKDGWRIRYYEGFVGKSPAMGAHFAHSPCKRFFDGNTVIVRLKKRTSRWLFIGNSILRFEPLEPICDYFSPLTLDDEPQPWAIDEGGNVYLFTENVRIDGMKLFGSAYDGINYFRKHNAYEHFYGARVIIGKNSRVGTIWLGQRLLEGLNWEPDPVEYYKRLKAEAGFEGVWIQWWGADERVPLTFYDYELLNARVGSERALRPFLMKDVSDRVS
jgi:hypothetical protein